MNGQTMTAKTYVNPVSTILSVLLLVFASGTSLAQVPVDEDGNAIPAYSADDLDSVSDAKLAPTADAVLSSTELEELVGPVALYPDDLLAIVLPASTYPLEIVQAARFLEQLEADSSLKPDEEWDDSIVALLNYPDVVRMMDEDIDWTWRLGEAVISQQSEVIAAVEAFRDRAYAAGNLKSDENQTVSYDEGIIEIVPVSEEIIYVPYYEPEEVVVYQPRPVYHYYPYAYPNYYYPYPVGYNFSSGYFWGVTTAFSIGWSNHYLHVYHPSYWGHPYYGRSYYSHYYRYPSIGVYNSWYVNNSYRSSRYNYRDGDYWRPRTRAGSRQDEPRVRNYHYPPGGDQRRRQDYSSRNQLNNRDNGRLSLNLRERNESDRNRVAAANNVRTGVASGGANNRRSTSSNRDQGTRLGGRISSNGDGRERMAVNDNRTRASASNSSAGNSRSGQNQARTTAPRPQVQFRDRSSENRASNSRNRVAPSANNRTSRPSQNQAQVAAATRQSRAAQQRVAAPPRATAARASAPTFQQRTPRASAPRASTPRASAPTVRQSAPPRTSAPRASAPRASAPRASAPRASAPSPQRAPSSSSRPSGQSGSGASQSRRSSSSRPRNHN